MAGVRVEWHYHNTTIDPPELVYFIKRFHPDVIRDRSRYGNFFKRAETRSFPARVARWCCKEYKEVRFPGRIMIVGIRVAESPRRAALWKTCFSNHGGQDYLTPIRLWPDQAVWEFIRERHLPYCELYDQGFDRLGCVGCPMAGKENRQREFDRWPKYREKWERLFRRLWEKKAGTIGPSGREWFGSRNFDSWEDLFQWWHDGQRSISKWREARGLQIKLSNEDDKKWKAENPRGLRRPKK